MLGDEVNEAARAEQAASGGQIPATKSLLERIRPVDAEELGFDPDVLRYQALEQLPGVSEKVVRDAGELAGAQVPVDRAAGPSVD